jgi:hypothetical protein
MPVSGGISNSDLVDLQRTTLENLPKMEFDIALKYQQYNVINEWFAKEKIEEDSGTSIVRNILLSSSGNAQFVRLYQKVGNNVGDVQSRITAPWCQTQSAYSIERREALRNRKPAMYIKLLESRRVDAMRTLADLLENRCWLAPDSSSDDLNPYGLAYWFSKVVPAAGSGYSATIDIPGTFCGRRVLFNLGTQTLTGKGGIDPTANSLWRNWADVFTAIDQNFVRLMRKAFHATKFKSPMIIKDLKEGPSSKYRIYMNLATLTNYEDLATKANEDIGKDLDPYHGVTTFKRVPVLYAPPLDSDTSNAVYGVNHDKFFPITLSGDWMRESDPMMDVEQHNVITTFVDCSFQLFSKNVREQGFVLHQALAA